MYKVSLHFVHNSRQFYFEFHSAQYAEMQITIQLDSERTDLAESVATTFI